MCACEPTWTCPRCREDGVWQDNGDEFFADPRFDRLVDEGEVLSLAEFRREAAAALGAVPVRRG